MHTCEAGGGLYPTQLKRSVAGVQGLTLHVQEYSNEPKLNFSKNEASQVPLGCLGW